jgi:hypothetical protein
VGRVAAAIFLMLGVSCAHSPMLSTLPEGPGAFARDGALAIMEITNRCNEKGLPSTITPLRVNLSVTGTIGRRRVDALMRVALGGGVRVELLRGREAPTVLATIARDHRTTLFLPSGRKSRVLRDESFEAILERLIGLSVDPDALSRVVSGCYLLSPLGYVSEYGENWRRLPGGNDGKVYAHRESTSDPWKMAALYYPGKSLQAQWRLDYQDYQDGFARTLRLTTEDRRVDLTFKVIRLEPRASLPETVFVVDVPSNAREITLADLDAL